MIELINKYLDDLKDIEEEEVFLEYRKKTLQELSTELFTIKNYISFLQELESKLNKYVELGSKAMIDFMDEEGIKSFVSDDGTITRSAKTFGKINKEKWNEILKFIVEKELYYLLRQQINSAALGELLKNGSTIPNVELVMLPSLRFTKSKKKEVKNE